MRRASSRTTPTRRRRLYLEVMERCRKLERGLLGQKSERLPDDSQLSLDVLAMMLDQRARAEASSR